MVLRPILRPIQRKILRLLIAAAQRIFITVNGVDEYFTFQNTKTFPDDFDLSIDAVLPTAATTVTLFGQTASADHYIKVLSTGFASINIDTSIVTSTVLATKDNKQRRYGVRVVGDDFIFTEDGATIDTVTDAVAAAKTLIINALCQSNGADFFNKTPSDPILTDLTTASNSVAWQLNRALPATTEQSTDGTNLLTYVGAPKTELFTFNQSDNQWVNAFFPNLLLRSEEIDDPVWVNGNVSIIANSAVAPDGTVTADKVTLDAPFPRIQQTVSVNANTEYTFSFSVKNIDADDVGFSIFDVTNASNIVAPTSYLSQINTNTYTRVLVLFTTGATTASINVYPLRDVGTTGSTLIWGNQLTEGVIEQQYKKTIDVAGRSIEIA